MSTPLKPSVKQHGGRRPGSGAPRGRRRRRSSLSRRRTPTPAKKRFKMMQNKRNHKIDMLQKKAFDLQQKNEQLNKTVQLMYERLGGFLDRGQMDDLVRDLDKFGDSRTFNLTQFNLILVMIYRARVAYCNIREVMAVIMSILWKTPVEAIMKKLIGDTTVRNWGTFRANWMCKLCLSLYVVVRCPPAQIMYKDDGTQRNNDNLLGHVVEFQMDKELKDKFKTCVINGETVDIDYFASYARNKNVSRLVFSYNQSVGKTADCLRSCTEESFEDFNNFIAIWSRNDNRAKLEAAFGAEQVDFTPLNLRVNAYGHDRHVVKFYVAYILAQIFVDRQ